MANFTISKSIYHCQNIFEDSLHKSPNLQHSHFNILLKVYYLCHLATQLYLCWHAVFLRNLLKHKLLPKGINFLLAQAAFSGRNKFYTNIFIKINQFGSFSKHVHCHKTAINAWNTSNMPLVFFRNQIRLKIYIQMN